MTGTSLLVIGLTWVTMGCAAAPDAGQDSSAGPLELAAAPWPMFRHDRRHTGQASAEGPEALRGPEVVAAPAADPLSIQDGEICCFGVWSSPSIGGDGTVFFGTTKNRDFGQMRDYFADPETNPGGLGNSGVFFAIGADGGVRFTRDTLLGNPAISAYEGGPLLGSDGSIIVGKDTGHLFAYAEDGSLLWTFPAEPTPDLIDTFEEGELPCTLEAFAAGDCQDCQQIIPSPVLGLEDDTVYFTAWWSNVNGDPDVPTLGWSKFYAVDARTGELRWSYDPSADGPVPRFAVASPAVGPSGDIYFATADSAGYGAAYAFHPSGELAWIHETDPRPDALCWLAPGQPVCGFVGSPVIGEDGTVYLSSIDTEIATVLALSPDGTQKWRATDWAAPHLGHALDGTASTVTDLRGRYVYSLALAEPNTVIFTTTNWQTEPGAQDRSWVVALRDDDASATMLWQTSVPGSVVGGLALDGAGRVFVGTQRHLDIAAELVSAVPPDYGQNAVWAFSPDGALLWSQTLENEGVHGSPALDAAGNLWVATDGWPYHLYRFER